MTFSDEHKPVHINCSLEGPDSGDLVVLINGLADDLTTWSTQLPALHQAGYRTLRYDNRGIGKSDRPPGPYASEIMAADLHHLLLHIAPEGLEFHLLGVSMGGMIAQTYALMYPNACPQAKGMRMLSLSLCCTYAQPTTFCLRMFELWADMASRMSVQDVMRDVMLWAYTVPFFRQREDELREVEEAMRALDMGLEEYLAQLNVIQKFDSTSQLDGLKAQEKVLGNLEAEKVMVLAGKTDILIPVTLSRELAEKIEGSRFVTVKGGHACMLEFSEDSNKAIIGFLAEQKGMIKGAS